MKNLSTFLGVLALSTAPSLGIATAVQSTTSVGPSTTINSTNSILNIPGTVDLTNFSFEVNNPATHSSPGFLRVDDGPFGENRLYFRAAEAPVVPDPARNSTTLGPGQPSTMFVATTDTTFYQEVRFAITPLVSEFQQGAQLGTDNWVYFSNNDNPLKYPSFWTQFEITETSITPIQYVHDPDDPFRDITFEEALAVVPEPSSSALLALSGVVLVIRRRR